ncbi:MAG: hypothetical protein B7Y02_18660, partial [Rhodobacterales bacterium 17-64-5]
MVMRLIFIGAAMVACISLAGLLAMTGTLRSILSADLTAEVHLSDYPLPRGFGLEPQVVADFMVVELTKRGTDDIALRLALGPDGQRELVDIAIPRLVNSVVVRDMITNIKPLANVLSVGAFRISGRVVVKNAGDARSDVALTLPGAVLVEAESGTAEISTTSTGLTALNLGDMTAGEVRVLRVWLGEAAVQAGAGIGNQVLLGDGQGTKGRVWLYGLGTSRQGADLQAMPMPRWVI